MKNKKFWQSLKKVFKNMWFWILYRTTHKFNLVKIKTLKPGYYDIDYRMLHVCFQLLTDYVEKEKPFDVIDWDHDNTCECGGCDENRFIASEIKDLYNWWKNVYPTRHEPIHDVDKSIVPPLSAICSGNLSEYPAWNEACNKTIALNLQWNKEDDRNLIRLMKIRPYLWT